MKTFKNESRQARPIILSSDEDDPQVSKSSSKSDEDEEEYFTSVQEADVGSTSQYGTTSNRVIPTGGSSKQSLKWMNGFVKFKSYIKYIYNVNLKATSRIAIYTIS